MEPIFVVAPCTACGDVCEFVDDGSGVVVCETCEVYVTACENCGLLNIDIVDGCAPLLCGACDVL
jgi:hypothetical protein